VGEIGLGFEHLRRQKPETIAAVVSEALENEINYFDLVWSLHQCQALAISTNSTTSLPMLEHLRRRETTWLC
jgi:hypothetical protein